MVVRIWWEETYWDGIDMWEGCQRTVWQRVYRNSKTSVPVTWIMSCGKEETAVIGSSWEKVDLIFSRSWSLVAILTKLLVLWFAIVPLQIFRVIRPWLGKTSNWRPDDFILKGWRLSFHIRLSLDLVNTTWTGVDIVSDLIKIHGSVIFRRILSVQMNREITSPVVLTHPGSMVCSSPVLRYNFVLRPPTKPRRSFLTFQRGRILLLKKRFTVL